MAPPSPSSSVSPEAQLACTALQVALDRAEPDALRSQLTPALDAERVARFCVHHGIVPSVYRALRTVNGEPNAVPLRETLAPSMQACAATGLHKAQVLADVLRRLADAGVEVMPLKGTGLDVRFYDGPGRRKDGDHDLLVRPAQLPDAVRVLSEMGFQSSRPDAPPPAQWPDAIPKHHAPPLVLPSETGPNVPVELHWNVSPDLPRFPHHDPDAITQGVWERRRSGTLLGAPVWWPAPEDDALVLLLHAARHLTYGGAGLYLRLAMLEDCARLVNGSSDLDLDAIRQRVRRAGPVHVLGPLRVVWQHALGGTTPTWLAPHDDASPWPPTWGQDLLSPSHLLGDDATAYEQSGRPHVHKLRSFLVSLLMLRRPTDRVRLVRRFLGRVLAPNEKDHAALPADLPAPLRALYVPLRLARLGYTLWRQ
jgi:hypothetical protein